MLQPKSISTCTAEKPVTKYSTEPLQSSLLRNNEKPQKGRAAIYLDSVILSYIQLSGRASVLLISAWISHINVEILSHQIMAVYAIHRKYLLLMLFIPVLGQP